MTTASRDELAARVLEHFSEVLAVPDAEPGDNFFYVGGNSLAAVVIANRIEDDFGVRVPLEVFFDGETLADVVEFTARAVDAPR